MELLSKLLRMEEVRLLLNNNLYEISYLEGRGGYSKDKKEVLYSAISRLEISKLVSIINDKDENAFVTIHDVSDVMGGTERKRAIH